MIFGERKLGNDEKVAEVGLSADSFVTAILRQNLAGSPAAAGLREFSSETAVCGPEPQGPIDKFAVAIKTRRCADGSFGA